jgi:hypothetical protein
VLAFVGVFEKAPFVQKRVALRTTLTIGGVCLYLHNTNMIYVAIFTKWSCSAPWLPLKVLNFGAPPSSALVFLLKDSLLEI